MKRTPAETDDLAALEGESLLPIDDSLVAAVNAHFGAPVLSAPKLRRWVRRGVLSRDGGRVRVASVQIAGRRWSSIEAVRRAIVELSARNAAARAAV